MKVSHIQLFLTLVFVVLISQYDVFGAMSFAIGKSFKSEKTKRNLKTLNKMNQDNASNNGNFQQLTKIADIIAANRHLAHVTSSMMCSVPREKVIRITSCYPYLSEDIYPSSTILHECSDASGCCGAKSNTLGTSFKMSNTITGSCDDELICAAAEKQIVTLHFHVYDYNGSRHVQELTFLNHTSCSCLPRPPGYSRVTKQEILCPWFLNAHGMSDEPRK